MTRSKNIGIVGITAEGASLCYRTIVSESSVYLGHYHHPEIFLHNPSFHTILEAQKEKDWYEVARIVSLSIDKLTSIGAEVIVIPANSVHYAITEITAASPIPVLNMIELVAAECNKKNFKKVAILGVGITMSDGLYVQPLKNVGIEPILPTDEDQTIINTIIYEEIVPGKVTAHSIEIIVSILEKLKKQGCDGVILGCTELPIVITDSNSPLPFIDTTRLLAQKALEFSLS